MSRRRLRPDELDLWKRVARTAERLHPERREVGQPPQPKANPKRSGNPELPPAPATEIPAQFRIGARAPKKAGHHDRADDLSEQIARQPLRMDNRAYGRLKRGKLRPEARIDLHGMTLDQAHPALIGFILRAQGAGKRLVLVITGKGRDRDGGGPIPVRQGVLRHQVPQWLSMPPLSGAVLQVSEAHLRHGGSGAFYVYLRRSRQGA